VAIAGVFLIVVRLNGHPGGDPHGTVLHDLLSVPKATPPGATQVTTSRRDAQWSAACPGAGGTSGWSPVTDLTTFQSSLSESTIVTDVGFTLGGDGWTRTAPKDDAAWQYTPIAEWTKQIPGSDSTVAVVFPFPNSSQNTTTRWLLGAEAKTPGYALPGC
jgi:hypothetical protein